MSKDCIYYGPTGYCSKHGDYCEYFSNCSYTPKARNGYSTEIFSDGTVYFGEFKNGLRHGKGKYRWANGNSYDGEWANDKRHGKGIMTFSNGDKFVGEYIDDTREGYGTMYYKNGKIESGMWKGVNLIKQG